MQILSQTIIYSSFEEYKADYPAKEAQGFHPYTVTRIARTGQIKVTWKPK